ncbi:MAG: ATP-binding protein [Candidatus Caldatribacteriota bacterium]|nr:ATP-binding protein [Candidatus Caldatribacteriota bacterium]
MKDLADHLFDILENSIKAEATEVKIVLGIKNTIFFCTIEDNGMGIKDENVTDPFVTSRKTRRVGLGLPLLKKAVEDTGGFLKISKLKKRGTGLEFKTDISHIDAKPFGDMASTFVDIIYSWPKVNFEIFIKNSNKKTSIFSSKEMKKIFSYSEMQHNEVREFIYRSLNKELNMAGINFQFGN